MPYTDKRLAYLSEVPSSVINPSTKSFVKDAMRRRYGLGDIVERHRMSMQAGMGLRDPLRQALLQRYATYGKWINRIVRRLSS